MVTRAGAGAAVDEDAQKMKGYMVETFRTISMCILRKYLLGCILIVFLGYCGCAYHETIPSEQTAKFYTAEIVKDDPVSRFSPVFLTYDHRNEYNRIGRPSAEL